MPRWRGQKSPFQEGMQQRLIAYKEKVQGISPGRQGDRRFYPHWTLGLFGPIARSVAAYQATAGFKLHRYVHHVRSSQAFAFNLFYPFAGPELHHLKQPLSAVIPHLAEVQSLAFEYVPEVDVLGEWAGDEPGVPFTASDVGIIFRTDEGHRGIALIEVKFTESGFTHCFGRRSRANHRRDVCRSWDVFRQEPAGCYLTRPKRATKDRRYWSIIKNQFGSIEGFFVDGTSPYLGCPFAGDFQQPMRNHALALGLEQAKLFDVAFLILAYHDGNDVILRKWKHYCQATVDQSRLGTLTASAVVDAVAGLDQGFWPDYIRYHAERYQIAAW